jgi:hypothetical protein
MLLIIRKTTGYFFWAAAALLVLTAPYPKRERPPAAVLKPLFLGTDDGLPEFGGAFNTFRSFLPRKGEISFIMDYPFHPYGKTVEQLYTAQSALIPLVLNPEPGEPEAVVFCSSPAAAEKRLAETGYRMTHAFGDGKGLARR